MVFFTKLSVLFGKAGIGNHVLKYKAFSLEHERLTRFTWKEGNCLHILEYIFIIIQYVFDPFYHEKPIYAVFYTDVESWQGAVIICGAGSLITTH